MTAVAREIVYALQSHPNRPLAIEKTRILVSSITNEENTSDSFVEDIKSVLNSSVLVNEINSQDIFNLSKNLKSEINLYDAAILSNVLTGENLLNNNVKLMEVMTELLSVLKPGGVTIIRENFENYSAQMIAEITKFLDVFTILNSNQMMGFNFYNMNQLQDSIYSKSNFLDVFWTLSKKVDLEYNEKVAPSSFREFLDKTQYTEGNVKSYEWIFGENFISPGGINENRRILKYFKNLRPRQQMLDIGVGIGGGARQVAKEFGVRVLGCDLSSNMILHAFERNQRDKDHRVEFQITDVTKFNYPPNSFDLVFSRDCIQHINNIGELLQNIYKWLKPGGELLITMYGKGKNVLKPKFLKYVHERQYYLKTIDEIHQLAKIANFTNIYTENMTTRFKEILIEERQRAIKNKDDFISKFSIELYNKILQSWEDKLQFIDDDNFTWLLIKVEKPL